MAKTINKKVVVFDFDGTIVDSMESFAQIASKVMPKYYDIDSNKAYNLYLNTSGIPFFQQLETIFHGNPINTTAANEFEQEKKKSYHEKKLFSDAADTLKSLKEKNVKVIISSNNFHELVEAFVSRLDIKFDMVLGYKENFSKGADHFEHIIKKTGHTKDEITFVGDSLKDADKANDFGVDFIAKEGIFTKNDFNKHSPQAKVISSLKELKEMF